MNFPLNFFQFLGFSYEPKLQSFLYSSSTVQLIILQVQNIGTEYVHGFFLEISCFHYRVSEIVRNYIRVPLLSTCILMSSPLKIPYFPQRFHPRAYPSHGVPREGKLVDIFKCLPNARAFLILLKLKGAGPYSGFVKLISFSICLHESDIHKV